MTARSSAATIKATSEQGGIPGTLIVAASVIGLARLIPIVNRLCRHAPPSPPHGKPTG